MNWYPTTFSHKGYSSFDFFLSLSLKIQSCSFSFSHEVSDFSQIDTLPLCRMRFKILLTSFLFRTRFEAVLFLFRTRFQFFHELIFYPSIERGLEFFWLLSSFAWNLKLFFSSFARDFEFFTNWSFAPLSARDLEFFWLFYSFTRDLKLFFSSFARDFNFFTN